MPVPHPANGPADGVPDRAHFLTNPNEMAIDRGEYDLIISDLRMPGVSGHDLHARLAETKPHLLERMGFVTGDTLGSSMDDFLRGCGRPVLEKPFTKIGVRCLIASILQPRVDA